MVNSEFGAEFPLGVEPIAPSGFEARGKMLIEYQGREMIINNTNNLWGYMQAIIAERQESLSGYVAKQLGIDVYLERLHREYPRLGSRITQLAIEGQQHMDALYGEDGVHAMDAYRQWRKEHIDTGEIPLLSSLAFDALAPMVDADGRNPQDIIT